MADLHGTSEAIILVKASPHVGKKHGETVCCAGVDDSGRWLRLYPVTFRTLDQAQQFKRWDRIKFCWHKPKDDQRPESLRVDHQSIEIVGTLKPRGRLNFLSRLEVTSIDQVEAQGKTFALLRPRKPQFFIKPKPSADLRKEVRSVRGFRRANRFVQFQTAYSYRTLPLCLQVPLRNRRRRTRRHLPGLGNGRDIFQMARGLRRGSSSSGSYADGFRRRLPEKRYGVRDGYPFPLPENLAYQRHHPPGRDQANEP